MSSSRYFKPLHVEAKMENGGMIIIKISSIDAVWEKPLNSYPKSVWIRVQVGTATFTFAEEDGRPIYEAYKKNLTGE